jgi:hypothetical protein
MFINEVEKVYAVKITSCEEFCKFYVIFLSVAEMLYGKHYNYAIFKAITRGRPNLYKCLKCDSILTTEESITHTLRHMKDLGYKPLAYNENI